MLHSLRARWLAVTRVASLGGGIVGGGNILIGVHIICKYLLCNVFYLLIQEVSHNSYNYIECFYHIRIAVCASI